MKHQAVRHEGGFTLIELLIATVVAGILMSAVVTSFVATANGTKDLHDRFVQSQDAQLLAAHFPSDVQSADPNIAVDTAQTTAAGWAVCSGAAPAGTTNVLQLRWNETSGATTTQFAAAYRTRQSGTDWQLVRYFCADSTPAVLQSQVVAHRLGDQTDVTKRPVVDTSTPRLLTLKMFAFSSTVGDYSYTFKGRMRTPLPAAAAPHVSSIALVGATPTNASSVSWTVLFDTAVAAVDAGDFNLDGLSGSSITGVTGGPTSWTVTASTGPGSGVLRLDLIDDNSIVDASDATISLGGTVLGDGSFTGDDYVVDRDAPVVASITRASASSPSGTPVSWTVTFSEEVDLLTVGAGDFLVVRNTGSTTWTTPLSVTSVDDTTVTVTTTPTGAGTIFLRLVDDDSILDAVGNRLGGTGAGNGTLDGEEYTITPATVPASISSINLQNGGTSAKIDEGDKVVVKFSKALDLNTLCSGWSGTTLSLGNSLIVDVADSGTNDTLSVGGTPCGSSTAFNFGSLDLNADYVSGAASFHGAGGPGNASSTISWNSATNELTITLGKKDASGNPFNTSVATSMPTYTVSPAVKDIDGNTVSPSSLTETTATRF